MPKLVNNEGVTEDNSILLDADNSIESIESVKPNQVLPVKTFVDLMTVITSQANEADSTEPAKESIQFKVWLAADESVNLIQPYLSHIEVVVLKVDNFMDGRFFSQARILRDQLDFKGDIRTSGNFIQDQLYYLSRCGVSSFSVPDDANIESLKESLTDFTDSYQAACDEPQPLFRRRA